MNPFIQPDQPQPDRLPDATVPSTPNPAMSSSTNTSPAQTEGPYPSPFTGNDARSTYGSFLPPIASTSRRTWPIAMIVLAVALVAFTSLATVFAYRAIDKSSGTQGSVLAPSSSQLVLPATVSDLQQTVVAVVHNVQPSVVEVNSSGNNGSGIGTGEFLTTDGYIVTNNHVVAGFSSYTVTLSDGSVHPATVVGTDAMDDLAVLKTDVKNATPIAFADSAKVAIGEFTVALGSPLGLDQSATFGIVSATSRAEAETGTSNGFAATSGPVLTGLIQTSAPINPGNSGGALLDLQGKMIGITTLGASGSSQGETISGIGFAIPSNRVQTVTQQLIQHGSLTSSGQGFLGISGQDVNDQSSAGVAVRGFSADAHGATPAQTAGIQVGDVITAIDGRAITSSTNLANAIFPRTPGTVISVTVQRNGASQIIQVKLGERPLSN